MLYSQDTTYCIKSINKNRVIQGYLIVKINNNKIISTERITSFKAIKRTYTTPIKCRKIKIKNIPKDKLEPKEYLKNRILDNGQ
jgi:hypothetical protein